MCVQASGSCCYCFSLNHMCTFHTLSHRMKIIQLVRHISPAEINVPSSHRLDHWRSFICTARCLKEEKPNSSLTLCVLFCPEGSSFFWTPGRCRGQSKTTMPWFPAVSWVVRGNFLLPWVFRLTEWRRNDSGLTVRAPGIRQGATEGLLDGSVG